MNCMVNGIPCSLLNSCLFAVSFYFLDKAVPLCSSAFHPYLRLAELHALTIGFIIFPSREPDKHSTSWLISFQTGCLPLPDFSREIKGSLFQPSGWWGCMASTGQTRKKWDPHHSRSLALTHFLFFPLLFSFATTNWKSGTGLRSKAILLTGYWPLIMLPCLMLQSLATSHSFLRVLQSNKEPYVTEIIIYSNYLNLCSYLAYFNLILFLVTILMRPLKVLFSIAELSFWRKNPCSWHRHAVWTHSL